MQTLQIVFVANAHPSEEQVSSEEPTVNTGKSLKFWIGTQMPTVSSMKGHNLKRLQTFTRKSTSRWHPTLHMLHIILYNSDFIYE